MAKIQIDIISRGRGRWRMIGICPEAVAPSGGLHVYRGADARVLDCASGDVIARGSSLSDVLSRLAAQTGLPVELFDEVNDRMHSTYQP